MAFLSCQDWSDHHCNDDDDDDDDNDDNNDNDDDNDDDEEEKEDPMIISIEYNDYQGSAGIKYSYTVELPDSLNGKHR